MERVYKSVMGYKPENEKNSATHVILSVDEYNQLQRQVSGLELKLKDTIANSKRELNDLTEKANQIIKDNNNKANKMLQERTESFQNDLDNANNEIDRLNDLNSNLLRISKERANSKRGLVPKKEHHGYIVLDAQQYNYIFRYNVGKRINTVNFPCWKLRIQSPYSATIPYKTIIKDIRDDLIKLFGSSLKVKSIIDVDTYTIDKFQEEWKDKPNFIFKTTYKANVTSEFWEVEYLVKESITIPPEMVAPVKHIYQIKRN